MLAGHRWTTTRTVNNPKSMRVRVKRRNADAPSFDHWAIGVKAGNTRRRHYYPDSLGKERVLLSLEHGAPWALQLQLKGSAFDLKDGRTAGEKKPIARQLID